MAEENRKDLEMMCNLSQTVKAKKENEVNIQVATDMLRDGEPIDKIKKYSRLSESIIEELAKNMGVAVVMQPKLR